MKVKKILICRALLVRMALKARRAVTKLLSQIHSHGLAIGMYSSSIGCQNMLSRSRTVEVILTAIRTPTKMCNMIVNLRFFLDCAIILY